MDLLKAGTLPHPPFAQNDLVAQRKAVNDLLSMLLTRPQLR